MAISVGGSGPTRGAPATGGGWGWLPATRRATPVAGAASARRRRRPSEACRELTRDAQELALQIEIQQSAAVVRSPSRMVEAVAGCHAGSVTRVPL